MDQKLSHYEERVFHSHSISCHIFLRVEQVELVLTALTYNVLGSRLVTSSASRNGAT